MYNRNRVKTSFPSAFLQVCVMSRSLHILSYDTPLTSFRTFTSSFSISILVQSVEPVSYTELFNCLYKGCVTEEGLYNPFFMYVCSKLECIFSLGGWNENSQVAQ